MPWSRRLYRAHGFFAFFGIFVIIAILVFVFIFVSASFLHSTAAEEKKISVYSRAANYVLPITERNGRDYVGLLEILDPLGTVNVKTDGLHWKLRYKDVVAEFTAGETRARIQGREFDLASSFLLENGRGLVPLASLKTLLPRFLATSVEFHETSRRLFIGNVAVHFTAQINKTTPPALVMNFSSPVNPMIATEPGKLRMVFTHEPLVPPGSRTLTFDSSLIPSASFDENNGAAEIAVTGSAPLLASFSNDGRTITIAPAPQTAAQAPPTQTSSPPGTPAANPPTVQPGSAAPAPVIEQPVPYFAVVDASHGGEERGAALTDQLAEKDVTLAFARRLRQALDDRGLNTLVLRDGDITLTLDQRASLTNIAHPKVYICVHAAASARRRRPRTFPRLGYGPGRISFCQPERRGQPLRRVWEPPSSGPHLDGAFATVKQYRRTGGCDRNRSSGERNFRNKHCSLSATGCGGSRRGSCRGA
jgi:N-acetylmuramoyl-L-alanine amidase